MLLKLTLLIVSFQTLLLNNAVSAIWMPDCSKPKNQDKPQCLCAYPTNWHLDVCQNFWHKPAIEENVGKTSRIVGGELAPRDAYPWFARLVRRNGGWWGCGGMLIAKKYVLTAAHCVNAGDANSLAVEIGAVCPYGSNNCGQPVQTINVQTVTPHPQYNSNTLEYDYALLELTSTANAQPVPIDQGNVVNNYANGKRGLYAIGFGTLSQGGSVASELRRVELAFVPRNTCNTSYGGAITNVMMCAKDPGQDSCQGDSGGPLYDQASNALVGVVSWGFGCADPNYPGVYAQVSSVIGWIRTNSCGSNPQPSYCSNAPTPTAPTPTAPTPTAPTPTAPTPTAPTPTAPTPTSPTPGTPPVATRPCKNQNKSRFAVSIQTDQYGNESSFTVYRRKRNGRFNKAIFRRGDFDSLTEVIQSRCFPKTGCYKLVMEDSYGDGLCCDYGDGSFQVYWQGSTIQNEENVFDTGFESSTKAFGNC